MACHLLVCGTVHFAWLRLCRGDDLHEIAHRMKKSPHRPALRPRQLALAALALLAAAPARATTYTWLNAGSDFTAGANWSPAGPPASATDLAQFTTRGTFGSAAVGPVVNSAVNTRLWFGNTATGGGYTLSGTGSVTGGSTGGSGLITRGIGNTTISLGSGTATSLALTGNPNSSPYALDVGYGSTLTLAGNTIATADSAVIHGTLVLDNSAGNPNAGSSQRLTLSTNNFFFSGGGATLEFKSASGGSTFDLSGTQLSNQVGYGVVRLNQATGATGPLAVTFGTAFASTTSSVNFVNAGSGTLGGGSAADPTLKFTSAPATTNGVISPNNTLGKWLVNGSDFAGYDATKGVFAITTTAVSGTLASANAQNSLLTGSASLGPGTVAYNTLKIAPTAAGQSLTMGGNTLAAGGSSAQSLLLAGSTSYALTGTGRLLTGNTANTFWVTDPAAVLSVAASVGPASGGFPVAASISKSGDGFLWLNGTANQVAYGSNAPTFGIQAGVLRVNSTSFDLNTTTSPHAPVVALRGGVLEYDVSGAAFSFTRSLGTSAGLVNWRGTSNTVDTGSGGFSAYAGAGNGNGNALTVNLGGGSATLTWGATTNFVDDGQALKFGSTLSNSTVIWQNPLALDGGTAGDYNIRQIDVTKGVGNAADKTQLTGIISGSSTTDLVKTGTGVLELTAANTYAGNTLVNGGKLVVTGSIAGATAINSGGTLGGHGTVGAVTINSGGRISPGDSPGTLATGAETWNGGGGYVWELNNASDAGAAKGTSYDWLNIGGALTLNNTSDSKFTIYVTSLTAGNASGFTPGFVPGQTYHWVIASSTTPADGFDAGKFLIDTSGFFNTPNTTGFTITQEGGDILLNLTYVPEPRDTALAIAALLVGLVLLRRRRAGGSPAGL